MHPASRFAPRVLHASERTEDTESTESCSSDDEQAGGAADLAVSQLARAFMLWDAQLIGPGLLTCSAHPGASAFAAFLTALEIDARPRQALRQEVLQWLRGLGADEARREQVLETVRENGAAISAMALYRLVRPAT